MSETTKADFEAALDKVIPKPGQRRLIEPKPADDAVLYAGDCLHVLTSEQDYVPDESVDLIYIDPPWNTSDNYVSFWKDSYRVMSFEDDFKDIHDYIDYMRPRVESLYRKLKTTGTLYLHCDWHGAHHLRVMLDDIFGENNFGNEIVWAYKYGGRSKKHFGRKHDTIFRYTKTQRFTFNSDDPRVRIPHEPDSLEANFRHVDKDGRRYREGTWSSGKKYRYYADEGRLRDDVWTDINALHQADKERLGYPTQKPVALLELIVAASSNPGDVVLDAFAGCGTTIEAAHNLGRKWIGIDVSHAACRAVAEDRLEARMRLQEGRDFYLWGTDLEYMDEAFLRGMSPQEFESWAVTQLQGIGNTIKTRDRGIDGRYYPIDKITYANIMKRLAPETDQRTMFEESYDYRPIQVKQHKAKTGREPIVAFADAVRREDKQVGYFVSFGFTKEGMKAIRRVFRNDGVKIVPATAGQILRGAGEIQKIHAAPDFYEGYLDEFEKAA